MIVVSNRVQVPDNRVDTFIERLQQDHGIEQQSGFQGLKVLAPVEADGHITMTFWDSLADYETWRSGQTFNRAHAERSSEDTFAAPNEVEIHEAVVERSPSNRSDETSEA